MKSTLGLRAFYFATSIAVPFLVSVSSPSFAAVRPKMDRPVDSYTDSSHALDVATKEGASTTKVGGGTLLQPPAAATTADAVKPTTEGVPPDEESRTASDELHRAPMPASSIQPATSDTDSVR